MAHKLHKKNNKHKKLNKAKKAGAATQSNKPTKATKRKKKNWQLQSAATRKAEADLYKKNGLHKPANLSKKQLHALQKQWYKKLATETDFVDIETVDKDKPDMATLTSPNSRAKRWHPERQLYFALARNFATHGTFKRYEQYLKLAWAMHAEGASYREILTVLRQKYRYKKSVYTLFYELEAVAKRCIEWNKTSPEGMLNSANYDSWADDALIGNWGLRLDEGFWESVPDGHKRSKYQ